MPQITLCPKCSKPVLVPDGFGLEDQVQCPVCQGLFTLQETLAQMAAAAPVLTPATNIAAPQGEADVAAPEIAAPAPVETAESELAMPVPAADSGLDAGGGLGVGGEAGPVDTFAAEAPADDEAVAPDFIHPPLDVAAVSDANLGGSAIVSESEPIAVPLEAEGAPLGELPTEGEFGQPGEPVLGTTSELAAAEPAPAAASPELEGWMQIGAMQFGAPAAKKLALPHIDMSMVDPQAGAPLIVDAAAGAAAPFDQVGEGAGLGNVEFAAGEPGEGEPFAIAAGDQEEGGGFDDFRLDVGEDQGEGGVAVETPAGEAEGAPAAATPMPVIRRRRPVQRSGMRDFLGAVIGGMMGLAVTYYLLCLIGGPQYNMFKLPLPFVAKPAQRSRPPAGEAPARRGPLPKAEGSAFPDAEAMRADKEQEDRQKAAARRNE